MADMLFDLDAEVSDSDKDDRCEVNQERLELLQGAGFIVASDEDGLSPSQSPHAFEGGPGTAATWTSSGVWGA